jgi:hypothetical protein
MPPKEAIALMKQLGDGANLDDVYARVLAGPIHDPQLFDLAEMAARTRRLDMALEILARIVALPRHNTFRAARLASELVPALRQAVVDDRDIGEYARFEVAEQLRDAGFRGPDHFRKLAGDSNREDMRLRASLEWYKAENGADALEALIRSVHAAMRSQLQPLLPKWLAEACELVCTTVRAREVEEVLVVLVAREDADFAVRRRCAVLLAQNGGAERAAKVLSGIVTNPNATLLDRVLSAWELGSIQPEFACNQLLAFSSIEGAEDASLDEIASRRTAARALIDLRRFREAARALLAMRNARRGDDLHRKRCDELWGIAVLGSRRAGEEIGGKCEP